MSRLIDRAFEIAKNEFGQQEISGNKDNPRIIEYIKSCYVNEEITLHDEIPWCSAFVTWCLQQAGGNGTKSLAARSYLSWGQEVKEPKIGDIVIFKRGNSKWQGHVSFIYEVTPLFLKCIGGNQDNRVCIEQYSKRNVLGYRTSKD